MGLMIPCYLFIAGNTLFAPFDLYARSRVLLFVLTALCMAVLCLAFFLADRHEAFFVRHEKKTLAAASLFYFAVQLFMAHILRYTPITDVEQCHTAARLIADTGTFGNVERSFIYFARYPFNLGFVYLLAVIFRFCSALGIADRYMPVVLAASALFTLGLLCGARVARRIGGVKAQTRMLILFASCLPFLYCSAEMYTDVFALAFPTATIYLAFKLEEAESRRMKLLFAFLFALCTFVGAQIRFTCVIAAIACMIVLMLRKRFAVFVLSAVLLVAVFTSGGALMDIETHKHISPEDIAQNELPRLHHIVMGLPVQPDEGYGDYGDGRWLVFSTSFDDPQERNAALLEEVIDRIYYLRYPNRLIHMMSRKLLSTFGDGTFGFHAIIQGDHPVFDHPVKELIYEWGGKYYGVYYHLTTALFISQMLLACAACLQALIRRNTRGAAVFIALLGIFLVLSMWETRPRYFFSYQMLLLLAAAMIETGRKRQKNQ